jgi:predicted amidohydrolase
MPTLRYAAACCQTDLPNPRGRDEIAARVARMTEMARQAVEGYSPFLPVRLLVFPEFAHAAPIHATAAELRRHLTVPIPNEHTERYAALCKEYGVYLQTGTFLEEDAAYPDAVFNTTVLVGPEGILTRYRKVNPWIPWEVHASPHDLPGYRDEYFPVARTPIGNLSAAICYDWLFPEAMRQMAANGAEVLIRVSAYMDPWGAAAPMDWWTVVNRCRAIENVAFVVAANQGASLSHYPPFSWPGGSMIVDFDGRVVVRAEPGPGERIVVGPVDVGALRHERAARSGHAMGPHLRTEAYPVYRGSAFAPGRWKDRRDMDVPSTKAAIEDARERSAWHGA